jgi:hypothetical protein
VAVAVSAAKLMAAGGWKEGEGSAACNVLSSGWLHKCKFMAEKREGEHDWDAPVIFDFLDFDYTSYRCGKLKQI